MVQVTTTIGIKEAGRRLGVHPNTVKNYILRGILPGFKTSESKTSHWRIAVSDLEAYMRDRGMPVQDIEESTKL